MEHLISKDALVAKKERMQDAYIAKLESRGMGHEEAVMASISYINGINDVINSLEVKEVDLEEEIKLNYNPADGLEFEEYKRIAKYYFELGLKVAQKGEKM